jgi:alpha-galactosidase
VVIYNRGRAAVLLPLQESLAVGLHVPAGHALEQWWVEKGAGTPTNEGTHRERIKPGAERLMRCWPSGRDKPRDAIPWTSVQDVDGRRGVYLGLEYTARLQIALKSGEADKPLELRAGLQADEKFPFFTRVLPGEQFEAPPVFIGCYQGDVDDGANRLRRWVRANLVPPTRDERYPLLVNNSWGSGMAVDERLARRMIDQSAELGLEMFHIDAGWFRTVGDWRADPKKFPNGLGPVADYAHQRGLKFGLWVGWTQGGNEVDPSGKHAILSVRDPEMAPWFCQNYSKDWRQGEFTGATVCLAEPKAVSWCLDTLRPLIKEAKLDLLEHDQTMVSDGCEQLTHPHTHSRVDEGFRGALGYYKVYDTLRAENPDLLFENCVNGGHMIDYGAVRRCHYISITDTYDPLSNRRAFYDASFALPPAICECYVQNVNVRNVAQFRSMLRSGMMGWCTIMTDTTKWTAEQHDAARREFANYKARLRPLIRSADLFHVSDRPDGVRWDGMEYFDAVSGRGALFAFRGKGDEAEHTFVLKGLDAAGKYEVTSEDGAVATKVTSGQELMRDGVRLKLAPETSEIVYLRRQ